MKRIISISIIALILLSFIGCSGKSKVKSLLETANLFINNKEFKKAKTILDSAKSINQWHEYDLKIKFAYRNLNFSRKLFGKISDSLLNNIIEKYNVNIEYYETGNFECYGDRDNLYFRVDDGGDLGFLNWRIHCPISDKSPEYVEDIEITTNNYFYVRDYNFHKIKGEWRASKSIYPGGDAEDLKMFKDIVYSSPVEIKFCGIENNFDYISLQISLNRNTYDAYWEIADNLW